jgi:hypothetical protein
LPVAISSAAADKLPPYETDNRDLMLRELSRIPLCHPSVSKQFA